MPIFDDLIKQNDTVQLENYLNKNSDIKFKGVLAGLKIAANNSAWNCFPILFKYANKTPVTNNNKKSFENFKFKLGKILMLAVKEDQTAAVESLLSFRILDHQHKQFSTEYRKLFYKKNNTTKERDILRDKNNKDTVLHLAVKNNNPTMCSLLLRAWSAEKLSVINTGYKLNKDENCFALCKARDSHEVTAYALALSLGNLECAKAIAEFYIFEFVYRYENLETVFKTLLHDIPFGYLRNSHLLSLVNPPLNIAAIFKADIYAPYWAYEITPQTIYNHYLSQPDHVQMSFITQSKNANTALGAFYNANDPKKSVAIKYLLKQDYDNLTGKAKDKDRDRDRDRDTDRSKDKNNNDDKKNNDEDSHSKFENKYSDTHQQNTNVGYSNHLLIYLESFTEEKKLSNQIKKLNLTSEEKKLFEEFIDPINKRIMDVPVSLYEIFYDIKTISPLAVDPNNAHEEFKLIEIQAAYKFVEKFEERVKQLIKSREENFELQQRLRSSTSITNVSLFTRVTISNPIIHASSESFDNNNEIGMENLSGSSSSNTNSRKSF